MDFLRSMKALEISTCCAHVCSKLSLVDKDWLDPLSRVSLSPRVVVFNHSGYVCWCHRWGLVEGWLKMELENEKMKTEREDSSIDIEDVLVILVHILSLTPSQHCSSTSKTENQYHCRRLNPQKISSKIRLGNQCSTWSIKIRYHILIIDW